MIIEKLNKIKFKQTCKSYKTNRYFRVNAVRHDSSLSKCPKQKHAVTPWTHTVFEYIHSAVTASVLGFG